MLTPPDPVEQSRVALLREAPLDLTGWCRARWHHPPVPLDGGHAERARSVAVRLQQVRQQLVLEAFNVNLDGHKVGDPRHRRQESAGFDPGSRVVDNVLLEAARLRGKLPGVCCFEDARPAVL